MKEWGINRPLTAKASKKAPLESRSRLRKTLRMVSLWAACMVNLPKGALFPRKFTVAAEFITIMYSSVSVWARGGIKKQRPLWRILKKKFI